MTDLLNDAIAEVQKLPADQQNAIATRILADLKDERAWAKQFESTTNDQWDRLAQLAKDDVSKGDSAPLNDVFPTDHPQK